MVKRSRGSALLITLILMGIVSVIAFGVAKMAMFQTTSVGSSEDSLGAWYAAEAGINVGLKKYIYRNYTDNVPENIILDKAKAEVTISSSANQIVIPKMYNYVEDSANNKYTIQIISANVPLAGTNLTLSWNNGDVRSEKAGQEGWNGCVQIKAVKSSGTSYLSQVPEESLTVQILRTEGDITIEIQANIQVPGSCNMPVVPPAQPPAEVLKTNLSTLAVSASEPIFSSEFATITSVGILGQVKHQIIYEVDAAGGIIKKTYK